MPDEENRSDERRRHARASLSLQVQFRFNKFEDFVAEYANDISAGGMFIATSEPREPGTFVYLQFALEDGTRLIEGTARVARVVPEGDPSGLAPGMGVEFVNLDAESIDVIHQIVAARVTPKRG